MAGPQQKFAASLNEKPSYYATLVQVVYGCEGVFESSVTSLFVLGSGFCLALKQWWGSGSGTFPAGF